MDIVIDTSAIIAVIVGESTRARLVQLTRDSHLHAPSSVVWEVGNAFSAMMRRGRATLEQVHRALEMYREIPIHYFDVDVRRALQLAHVLGIYAYDAYVIEAAVRKGCPLLTLDRGLRHAARECQVDVLEV